MKSWAGMKDRFGIPQVFDGESVNDRVDASAREMSVVANKLKGCNFLLNKDFKTNAKYYLCLVKADGTLVEEDHPMKLFTDKKLRELKTASLDPE